MITLRTWMIVLAGWVATGVVTTLAYVGVVNPGLRLWEGEKTHGNPAVRTVALTFDDGPHPLWAPLLADSLERHGARGTFMLVGKEAVLYPELVARLARGGHQIASHSMTHPYPNLTTLPAARVDREVVESTAVLQQLSHQQIIDFRPPGGGVNDAVLQAVRRHGLRIAWWSYSMADAEGPTPTAILGRLVSGMRPGSVALLHERANTVPAVETLLASPEAGRFRYVTFDELIPH